MRRRSRLRHRRRGDGRSRRAAVVVCPAAPAYLGASRRRRSATQMRLNYAEALYADDDATLDDLRKAVTTLEDAGRTARRVFGSTHPLTEGIEDELQKSRAALGGSSKARGSN